MTKGRRKQLINRTSDDAETRESRIKRLFPWADPKEYDQIVLPADLQVVKEKMRSEFVQPYNFEYLPGYVLKQLTEAAKVEGLERARLVVKAWDRLKMSHLAHIAKGLIHVKEPMPEDVKQHLRELGKRRRERQLAQNVMPIGEVAQKLVVSTVTPVTFQLPKMIETNKVTTTPKPSKVTNSPTFEDTTKQEELKKKYPWIVVGTFCQDPKKLSGTIVDIECQLNISGCLKTRTVHLADVFQVKACIACKKNGKRSNHNDKPKLGK